MCAIMLSFQSTGRAFCDQMTTKKELFHYLADSGTAIQLPGVEVITTSCVDVVSPCPVETEGLAACNHEEADTRIFIHVKHASTRGLKKVLIRTVDTDVVVLAIAYAKHLALQELWIAFGVGNHFRYLPIHKITTSLTEQQCEALPFFMLTQGVILSYTLREKERRQLSKRGSQILKSMKSFVSYHLLEIQSLKNSVVSWSDLWLSCIVIRVPTRQSTKLDKFYLRKVIKPLRTFLQLKPLLHSTSKEQPIRPVMYGVKSWNLCRNSQVRQSGAGSNHQKVGLPSGLC